MWATAADGIAWSVCLSVCVCVCVCVSICWSRTHVRIWGLSRVVPRNHTCMYQIRWDTIYLRALKSWRNGPLSLAHGTETKNLENTENKKRLAQKKTVRAKVRESSREDGVEIWVTPKNVKLVIPNHFIGGRDNVISLLPARNLGSHVSGYMSPVPTP